jgi:hypothetical protein
MPASAGDTLDIAEMTDRLLDIPEMTDRLQASTHMALRTRQFDRNTMTPAQCRAGRALINWSELAASAEVGDVTLRQFERGAIEPRRAILKALQRALEQAGVKFIDANRGGGPGVRLRDDRR